MRMNMNYSLDAYQYREKALKKILKIIEKQKHTEEGGILFFGDSIIEGIPNHLPIINNGISGMSSKALENLLDELVIKFKPSQVYLHVGTNDFGNTVKASPKEIAFNVFRLMLILKKNLPDASLNVISTLPCLDEKESYHATKRGLRSQDFHNMLNQEYQDHLDVLDVNFIDLAKYLINEDGTIKTEYYSDGLHINQDGYQYLIEKFQNIDEK